MSYNFFDKTCSLRTEIISIDRGSEKLTKWTITTGVLCDFRSKWQGNRSKTPLARETDESEMEVVLDITYKSTIKKWMMIELFDQTSRSKWEYIINSVDIFDTPGLTSVCDCILLNISAR